MRRENIFMCQLATKLRERNAVKTKARAREKKIKIYWTVSNLFYIFSRRFYEHLSISQQWVWRDLHRKTSSHCAIEPKHHKQFKQQNQEKHRTEKKLFRNNFRERFVDVRRWRIVTKMLFSSKTFPTIMNRRQKKKKFSSFFFLLRDLLDIAMKKTKSVQLVFSWVFDSNFPFNLSAS